MSKKLDSILNRVPPATATYSSPSVALEAPTMDTKSKTDRLVAVVPKVLKDDIKAYLSNHSNETERTVILRGLKELGFNVPNEWLVDKRSLRRS